MDSLCAELIDMILKYVPIEMYPIVSRIRIFYYHLGYYSVTEKTYIYAAKDGYLSLLQWCCRNAKNSKNVKIKLPKNIVNLVVERGDLQMIEWLGSVKKVFPGLAWKIAVRNGHLQILDWLYLHKQRYTPPKISLLYINSVRSDQEKVFFWLRDHFPDINSSIVTKCIYYARKGRLLNTLLQAEFYEYYIHKN